MDPSWVIAGCSVLTLFAGGVAAVVKFVRRVRRERATAQQSLQAQAQEALRIAREETDFERKRYLDQLLEQIRGLKEEVDNEQRAREALQRRYEDLLAQKGTPGG